MHCGGGCTVVEEALHFHACAPTKTAAQSPRQPWVEGGIEGD